MSTVQQHEYSTTAKYTVLCIYEHKEVFKKNKLLIKIILVKSHSTVYSVLLRVWFY